MIELTVHEGDGDAARTGYWTVTGTQDEHETYGTIERSLMTDDDERTRVVHAWYITQRTLNAYRQTVTTELARGIAETYDDALSEVRLAWHRHVGDVAPAEDTAEVIYPWQGN